MSRRNQIQLSEVEITEYLSSSRTMILVSNGKDGHPHPMPMWFAVDIDNCIYMTTFRKSQKINNLRKDPRATLLIESGDAYEELKGLVVYTDVEFIEDVESIRHILEQITLQRSEIQKSDNKDISQGMLKTAEKRIGLKFTLTKILSWDHSKLDGVY